MQRRPLPSSPATPFIYATPESTYECLLLLPFCFVHEMNRNAPLARFPSFFWFLDTLPCAFLWESEYVINPFNQGSKT